jgi:pantothenate kinase
MERIFHELALDALGLLQHRAATTGARRVIIALGGTPGSGKSTMAARVTAILNNAYEEALTQTSKMPSELPTYEIKGRSNECESENNSNGNANNQNNSNNNSDRPLYSNYGANSSTSTISSEEYYPLSSHAEPINGPDRSDVYDIDLQIQKNSFSETNQDLLLVPTHVVNNPEANTGCQPKSIGGYICNHRQQNNVSPRIESRIKTSPVVVVNENTPSLGAKTDYDKHGPERLHPTFATTVPMDGYHLTRSQLDKMQDPVEAHKRRGSPWTFDVHGVVQMAEVLHKSCYPTTTTTKRNTDPHNESCNLYFPAFDHAIKDPVPDAVTVDASARIVIIEGLYTLLDVAPWNCIGREYVDLTWFINAPLDTTRLRLARRHLRAGIVASLDEGFARVDINDSLNARYIQAHLLLPDRVIESIEEDLNS